MQDQGCSKSRIFGRNELESGCKIREGISMSLLLLDWIAGRNHWYCYWYWWWYDG
jgi:hypothetical protein